MHLVGEYGQTHTSYTPYVIHTVKTTTTTTTTWSTNTQGVPVFAHASGLLQRSAMSMAESDMATSARRRRQRQLRSFLRQEELSVKMALARALHHSAQWVEEPREGVEGETYDAPRRLKPPPPGMRPASLAEQQGDVVQVQRHTVEQLADGAPRLPTLDVPVPQMVDKLVAVLACYDTLLPEQAWTWNKNESKRLRDPTCVHVSSVVPPMAERGHGREVISHKIQFSGFSSAPRLPDVQELRDQVSTVEPRVAPYGNST